MIWNVFMNENYDYDDVAGFAVDAVAVDEIKKKLK